MMYFLVIVGLVSYCSAGDEYAPSRPLYKIPEQRAPIQYDDAPYAIASPSDYQSAPVQYSNIPKDYLQSRPASDYQSAPVHYSNIPKDYLQSRPALQYEPAPYQQSDNADYYGDPEQVVIPQSAGVHDGGAEIPGLGFVKGYPFSYLVNEPEGYNIPGLGFIAGYPFSYIGPYIPKSDPKTDTYSESNDYRYPASMENPEESYPSKNDNSYLYKAQSLLPPQTANAYTTKYETSYPSEDNSQIKPVKVQFVPPIQNSYASPDSYSETRPNQMFSPQSYVRQIAPPRIPMSPISYYPSQTASQPSDPYAAFNPTPLEPYGPKQDTIGDYSSQPETVKYSSLRYRPEVPMRSLSHIPKSVQLPRFLRTRPSQLRTQSDPTYQYK